MIDDQVNPQTEVEQLFVRTSELARQLAEMDPEEARQRFREMGLGAKEQAMLLAAVLALRGEDDVGHK
jgi:Fe-S cluster assembly scaffold protein SufB